MSSKPDINYKLIKTDLSYSNFLKKIKKAYLTGKITRSSGAYATCYFDSKKAVKIFDENSNGGYCTFLKMALRNQNNKLYPKIYSYNRYEVNGEVYGVVVMERLYHSKKVFTVCDFVNNYISGDVDYVFELFKGTRLPKKVSEFKNICDKLNKASDNFCIDIHNDNIMTRKNGQIVFTDPLC